MEELRLNRALELDPAGAIVLQREGDRLNAWFVFDELKRHFNPFCFGEAFNFRALASSDVSALEEFLRGHSPSYDEHVPAFPVGQQLEVMKVFLMEEHMLEFDEKRLELLCEFYAQLYPIFWRYAITSGSCILYDGFYGRFLSESYLSYQSSTSYRELVENVFGVARKDTMRVAGSMDAMALSLAFMFKDVLPVDILALEFSSLEGHFSEFPLNSELYRGLTRLSVPLRRRLLRELVLNFKLEASFVEDALELLELISDEELKRLKGSTNWGQFHNRLMRYCDVVEGDELVKPPEIFSELEKPAWGLVFKPLVRAIEFAELGDELAICIGKAGYWRKSLHGESYCFAGLDERGKPLAALEVKKMKEGWRVQQLRGYDDSWIPQHKEIVQLVEKRLNGEHDGEN